MSEPTGVSVVVENPDDPLASAWMGKIGKANLYYNDWSAKFKCDTMEEYYYGFQWKDASRAPNYERYVINFVFSTLEIKKPTLLFTELQAKIKPRPKSVNFDYEAAVRRCQLRELTLNTILADKDNDLDEEFEMFLTDAFFRFGILETGYSADWAENPKAGMPVLKSDNDTDVDPDSEDNIIKEPAELPINERVYYKRIPAWRFRVGGIDGHNFQKCSWVGYYDYYRIEDVKANKNFINTDKIKGGTSRSDDALAPSAIIGESSEDQQVKATGDYCKIWTIYDLRAKKKYLFMADQCITLKKSSYKRFPLLGLRFVKKLRGWYPVPLVFNWKSPQDEINEAREQQRVHRRRGNRIYLYKENAFDDDTEISKLEDGVDMTFAKVKESVDPSTAVAPLQNAQMDNVTNDSMMVARDDLNIVTGTSADQRGQQDRQTATSATIQDQRTQLRETRARVQVAEVLKDLCYNTLMIIQDKFTLPIWIKMNTVPSDQDFMQQKLEVAEEWKQITANDLGEDEDFEVDIKVTSVSPIEAQAEFDAYVKFLGLCNQFPQTAFSPTLIRENAYRSGYKNEKVIREMMEQAQIAAIGREAQAQQALGGIMGGGKPPGSPMDTPGQQQINQQLNNQVGPMPSVPVQ